MSLFAQKSAVLERLLAQKAKLPSTGTTTFRVASFSSKRGRPTRPPAVNLRRRNAIRRPTPNSLMDTTMSTYVAQQGVGSGGAAGSIGPYGLRRVDYAILPSKWPLPPHPPPRKNPVRRYFPLVTLGAGLIFFVWIIVNRDDSVYEYWKQVETGHVPMDRDDDDDDDFDDDDDDDDDEWEDSKK
jgi:hypothetical protein